MKKKPKQFFKKGEKVLIRKGIDNIESEVQIREDQEPSWNGFTWMYAFVGEDIRLGEMYLRRVPISPVAEAVSADPEIPASLLLKKVTREPQIRDNILFLFYKEDPQGNPIYLPEADIKVLADHEITLEEITNWAGGDNPEIHLNNLLEIVNNTYTVQQFRYDVISYDDYLLTGRNLTIFPNGIEILR